jgi:hypothetical protein
MVIGHLMSLMLPLLLLCLVLMMMMVVGMVEAVQVEMAKGALRQQMSAKQTASV